MGSLLRLQWTLGSARTATFPQIPGDPGEDVKSIPLPRPILEQQSRCFRTGPDLQSSWWRGNCAEQVTLCEVAHICPDERSCTPLVHTRLHTPLIGVMVLSWWTEVGGVMMPP